VLILAFDTSGLYGSVALLDGPCLLAERILLTDRRSAQTLAPAIAELLASQHISAKQIRLVGTTIGPGSFTGLRVGITAAKAFAYAAGADVLGISTLESIAHGIQASQLGPDMTAEVHAILDAQRKELFLARFRSTFTIRDENKLIPLTRLTDDAIISIEDWLASLKPGTIVAGAGLDRLHDRLPSNVVVDPQARQPNAAIIGHLAYRDYQSGRRDDLWKLAPLYLRPSYAEEKAAKSTPPTGA
jgi:tRNA threonylcarbamoyladenosine biosynthesis protein TsaB